MQVLPESTEISRKRVREAGKETTTGRTCQVNASRLMGEDRDASESEREREEHPETYHRAIFIGEPVLQKHDTDQSHHSSL